MGPKSGPIGTIKWNSRGAQQPGYPAAAPVRGAVICSIRGTVGTIKCAFGQMPQEPGYGVGLSGALLELSRASGTIENRLPTL